MKNSKEIKKIPNSLKGYLLTFVNQSFDSDEMCIYGNSEGLISLGKALISIGEMDQSKLLDSECPKTESFHHHFTTSQEVDVDEAWNLKKLTIGRVEEKESGKIKWNFPSLKKEEV